ncbi:Eco57I restriction-modification methylase domain-containing protein [Microcoleus sp. Pol11C1]|uniref:Eco57I restriction-modification methylase domain-containing protein n=1 Tax=unclassified Microcoleus TaxID=2642155 RepID=UPI002FD25A74
MNPSSKGVVPGYQLFPQYPVARAGQGGGTGSADLGIAWFENPGLADTLQVACEFKDVRSGLDAPQNRKGNDRSPVKQCADYLKESRANLFGNESIQPQWAIVTDMNEFRLYYWARMPGQYQRFVVADILGNDERSCFQRFLLWRIFQSDLLLSVGGPSRLERMLGEQWLHEKNLETGFYRHYQAFREKLYRALVSHNPEFGGTRGDLVRLSQRIVDRLIFVLYCEDMGRSLDFPQNLLRDILSNLADPAFYQADDTTAWDRIKQLFRAMANGTPFANRTINRFNGGLFSADSLLDSLQLPTEVFCASGQNVTPDCAKDTLLYLSAHYNFGLTGDGNRTITLLTLGRIFEQSITELEIRAAEEDDRPSLGKLSKRKRDGVYYTPEWTTRFIVEETVGRRLDDIKVELGWRDADYLTDDQIERKTTGYHNYVRGLVNYRERLESIRVIDPACGSGAFLIQALEFLLAERRRVSEIYSDITRQPALFDHDQAIRAILSQNIFGVDINPESVEITKLALWLHTAVPGAPLTTLDSNVRCGNSLVGPEIYAWREDLLSQLNIDEQERINAFDWQAAFPQVFNAGGFDCVVGNPPYVKLQNFRRVESHSADYLISAERSDGTPYYHSTRTGNFDLYLPFIEKGLSLLNPDGRMGYIAPSVWLKNEYGEALRALIRSTGQLERWVDFASFMVFDEAIVYTALQFFTSRRNDSIRFAYAHDGAVHVADWANADYRLSYVELPSDNAAAWNLLPARDRELMTKLHASGHTLASVTEAIVVGIQTSADSIYHLNRIGTDQYRSRAGVDVEIEDRLMKALVSGAEAVRYATPCTDTYLLFPYLVEQRPGGGADTRLFTGGEMTERFPKGWAYLRRHELALRARENNKMDLDGGWWGYNYPKNLDKQHLAKLIVPRLVETLYCSFDDQGAYSLDNVDAGGIVVRDAEQGYLLSAILNSDVLTWAFLRISKPFQNGYYSANKQFIAPLPIPDMHDDIRDKLIELSRRLQERHTEYRNQTLLLTDSIGRCNTLKAA